MKSQNDCHGHSSKYIFPWLGAAGVTVEVLTTHCKKKPKQLAFVRGKKSCDCGFLWDTNAGLLGRGP